MRKNKFTSLQSFLVWFPLFDQVCAPLCAPLWGTFQMMCPKCPTLGHILLFFRFCALRLIPMFDFWQVEWFLDANCRWSLIYDFRGVGRGRGQRLIFGVWDPDFWISRIKFDTCGDFQVHWTTFNFFVPEHFWPSPSGKGWFLTFGTLIFGFLA